MFTNGLTHAVTSALIEFLWQGALVALGLWVLLIALRRASANTRYLVSCAGLLALAALPVVSAALQYRRALAHPAEQTIALSFVATAVAQAPNWLRLLEAWTLPLWATGVLALSLRVVWNCRQVTRLRGSGEMPGEEVIAAIGRVAARLRVTRAVRSAVCNAIDGPSVIGWLRPVILLPAATLAGLTPEQLESILAHELAHVRRHDYLVNLMQMIVETVLFYHPAVWWVSARIRHERELACDDIAVGVTGDATVYARALSRLERLRLGEPALAASGSSLSYRIRRLIGAETRGFAPSRWPGIATLMFGVACLALNMNRAHAQEPQVRVGFAFAQHAERGVKVDSGSATILHRAPVEYPEAAIERQVKGRVTLEATLDSTGEVSDARVMSGPAELRKAALESVLQWHFAKDSAPVQHITIDFTPPTPEERAKDAVAFTVDTKDGPISLSVIAGAMEQANRAMESIHLEDLQLKLEGVAGSLHRLEMAGPDLNEVLGRLDLSALSEALQKQVEMLDPIHLGDMLTSDTMGRLEEALKGLDQHLGVECSPMEGGKVKVEVKPRRIE